MSKLFYLYHSFLLCVAAILLSCAAYAQNDFFNTKNIDNNPRFADVIVRAGGYGGAYTSGHSGLDVELIVAPTRSNFQLRAGYNQAIYSEAYQDYTKVPNQISRNPFNKFMMLDVGGDYFFWNTTNKGTAKVGVDAPLLFANRKLDVATLIRFSVAGRLGINYSRMMLSPANAPGGQIRTEDGRTFGQGATESEDQGAVYVQSTMLSPYLGLSFNLGRGLMTRVKGVRDRANYQFITLYTDLLISARNSIADIQAGNVLYSVTENETNDPDNFRESRTGFRGGLKAVYGRELSVYAKLESGLWPGYHENRFFWLVGAGASINLQIFDHPRR